MISLFIVVLLYVFILLVYMPQVRFAQGAMADQLRDVEHGIESNLIKSGKLLAGESMTAAQVKFDFNIYRILYGDTPRGYRNGESRRMGKWLLKLNERFEEMTQRLIPTDADAQFLVEYVAFADEWSSTVEDMDDSPLPFPLIPVDPIEPAMKAMAKVIEFGEYPKLKEILTVVDSEMGNRYNLNDDLASRLLNDEPSGERFDLSPEYFELQDKLEMYVKDMFGDEIEDLEMFDQVYNNDGVLLVGQVSLSLPYRFPKYDLEIDTNRSVLIIDNRRTSFSQDHRFEVSDLDETAKRLISGLSMDISQDNILGNKDVLYYRQSSASDKALRGVGYDIMTKENNWLMEDQRIMIVVNAYNVLDVLEVGFVDEKNVDFSIDEFEMAKKLTQNNLSHIQGTQVGVYDVVKYNGPQRIYRMDLENTPLWYTYNPVTGALEDVIHDDYWDLDYSLLRPLKDVLMVELAE